MFSFSLDLLTSNEEYGSVYKKFYGGEQVKLKTMITPSRVVKEGEKTYYNVPNRPVYAGGIAVGPGIKALKESESGTRVLCGGYYEDGSTWIEWVWKDNIEDAEVAL